MLIRIFLSSGALVNQKGPDEKQNLEVFFFFFFFSSPNKNISCGYLLEL